MKKFNRNNFDKAKEIFGVIDLDGESKPEDFKDKVIRDNRIGSFIDFHSITNNLSTNKDLAKMMGTAITHAEHILGDNLSDREKITLTNAINVIALYSEMCVFDGIQKTYGIKISFDKSDCRYIRIKSIPIQGGRYRISLEHEGISAILNPSDRIPLSMDYQIALDIYKGMPKFDSFNINDEIITRMRNTLDIIDSARSGILCTRDIFVCDGAKSQGLNVTFVPVDIVCVGVLSNGKRKVVPYIMGILMNPDVEFDGNAFRGYAIKASNGSFLNKPTFMEPCKNISLFGNRELFLELIDKDEIKDEEHIVLNSLRVLATAMLSFNNAHMVDYRVIYDLFKNYRFHDDFAYEQAKENSIKIG